MHDNTNLPQEATRSRFLGLRTRQDLAALLGIDEKKLIYYADQASSSQTYTSFSVPKKSGGARQIKAPVRGLKAIQSALNQTLQCVYEPEPTAHGFVAERSIVTNAAVHTGQQLIFNIDLLNFFPSITAERVYMLLLSAPYEMEAAIAMTITRLCCADDRLPQGAPTSPVLSNMVCSQMDRALAQLAITHECRYTRYADDITFSTIQWALPDDLAIISHHPRSVTVGQKLSELLLGYGFTINYRKVRVRTPLERQDVTGLTVNTDPNVTRSYIRQIRAMLHAWEKFGREAAEAEFIQRYDQRRRFRRRVSFPAVVSGKISFVSMVRGDDDPVYLRLRRKYEALIAREGGYA
ncbi:MAG: reverse transcriptase domain-containing protein [Roseiflexaceae bacterium]